MFQTASRKQIWAMVDGFDPVLGSETLVFYRPRVAWPVPAAPAPMLQAWLVVPQESPETAIRSAASPDSTPAPLQARRRWNHFVSWPRAESLLRSEATCRGDSWLVRNFNAPRTRPLARYAPVLRQCSPAGAAEGGQPGSHRKPPSNPLTCPVQIKGQFNKVL